MLSQIEAIDARYRPADGSVNRSGANTCLDYAAVALDTRAGGRKLASRSAYDRKSQQET